MNSFEKAQVNLTMPKFKYNYDISMKKTLTKLGMNVAFSSDLANFDSISISKPLFIGDVIHQTFINVTEKGTEAAAITYVNTRGAAMPEKEKEFNFVLDHPFVFVIRENRTGTIIFMGKVVEPVY